MQSRQIAGYSGLQIGLHWSIAALVFFQLVFGESMTIVVEYWTTVVKGRPDPKAA
jgi:cytochrome b561